MPSAADVRAYARRTYEHRGVCHRMPDRASHRTPGRRFAVLQITAMAATASLALAACSGSSSTTKTAATSSVAGSTSASAPAATGSSSPRSATSSSTAASSPAGAPASGTGAASSGAPTGPAPGQTVTQADIDKAMTTPTTLTFWTWVPNIAQEVAVFEKKYPAIKIK